MSLSNKSSLTIIVPLFNQAIYVEECLSSIEKITSIDMVQLIIIDDCSKDKSVDIVEAWLAKPRMHSQINFDILFLKNEVNLGICASLNKALSFAKFDIISLCAADDILLPDSLSKKVAKLKESNYDALLSDVYIINEHSEIVSKNAYKSYFKANTKALSNDSFLVGEIITNWCIPGPSALIKRTAYEKIGNYNTKLMAEDREFYLRLFRDCNVTFDFEPIAAYRIHSTNISKESTFRKKMNEEIRATNALHSIYWIGINKWFLYSYSLGDRNGVIVEKILYFYSCIIRRILRSAFKIKVFFLA
ncbi:MULTISPECIES: glycosyltransferase [unclassified Serratia (in: enterobacteria)]|uniref:glycosyltransferase n=1 Tax=unclassified Serratia (in: enterobacteria) TaxID=2647522 RepID=UPI0030764747